MKEEEGERKRERERKRDRTGGGRLYMHTRTFRCQSRAPGSLDAGVPASEHDFSAKNLRIHSREDRANEVRR